MESIKAKLDRVRTEYRDAIAKQIVDEPGTPYERIAREHDVTLQWVLRLVRERGLSRRAKKTEATNG